MKKAIYITITIIIVIICGLITYRFTIYNESYDSLKEAIEKTTNNGSIESKINYKNGVFAYIKNSKKRTIGYYYKNNNKWYLDKYSSMKSYPLTEKYILTTYYYQKQNLTFIEIQSIDKRINNVSDSLKTYYNKLTKNKEEVYLGVYDNMITKDYKLIINNKKYKAITPKKVYRGENTAYVEDE